MARIPALTADQMREVDRIAVEELGLQLIQMMENAGRHLADLAVRRFRPRRVTVLAGPGGNGGGGLAGARHLHNRGVAIQILLARPPERLAPVPRRQLAILERLELPIAVGLPARPAATDLVVDALLGYSMRGDPQPPFDELIEWANAYGGPVLALDGPSGLDLSTGQPRRPCIRAAVTLTLALPKRGLLEAPQVGELYLADIAVPPEAYLRLGLRVPPLFRRSPVRRLRRDSG